MILNIFIAACSSTPRHEKYEIRHIILYNIHVRRPEYVGAAPNAVPGEYEYVSHPQPGAHFDCTPLSDLFKNIDLEKLRHCLQTVNEFSGTQEIVFRLHREQMPYLQLEDLEHAPACIKEMIEKIPVPREIFFQTDTEGSLSCYNSRLPLEADEVFGVKLPFIARMKVKLKFPMSRLPSSIEEMKMTLGSWAILPFTQEAHPFRVESKLVPDGVCTACLGDQKLFINGDDLPPKWP